MTQPVTAFHDLPEEALITALGFLDPKSVSCAARCCRSLATASRNERVWRAIAARELLCNRASDSDIGFPRESSWKLHCLRMVRSGTSFWNYATSLERFACEYTSCSSIRSDGYSTGDRMARRAAWDVVHSKVSPLVGLPDFIQSQTRVLGEALRECFEMPKGKMLPEAAVFDLAELAELWFLFDFHKMLSPEIQNDYCFFHRYCKTYRNTDQVALQFDDKRNMDVMFFLSQSSPIITSARRSLEICGLSKDKLAVATGHLARSFYLSLEGKPTDIPQMEPRLALQGLAGCLMLYDTATADDKKAFGSKCPFPVAKTLELLRLRQEAQDPPLINFLRYYTLHLSPLSAVSSGTDKAAMNIIASLP